MNRSALQLALLASAALSIGAAGAAEERSLTPEDFAFGRAIEIQAEGPLQSVLLDWPVYQGSIEPRLADLRVMNAAGEPVPHAVRQLGEPTRREAQSVPLPFFELGPSAAPGGAASGPSDHRIRAEVSDSGALVTIDSRPAASATPSTGAPPPAYLLDASQVDAAIEQLELELGDGATGFVVPVRVEGSDDLVRFTPIGEGSVLARLEQGGHRIEKRDVELGASRHRYLRIRWPAARLPVRVTGVRARLAPEVEAPARAQRRVRGEPMPETSDAFLFDLGGQLPADRAQILLPETNTLLQAQIFSGPDREGPWQRHFDGLLYRFEYGETLRNPEIAWPISRHRYVKLEVAPNAGLGSGAPELEVRWSPEQLLFITRGEAPYQLAYGRWGAPATPFDASEILEARPTPDAPVPRETARLGAPLPLGDPSVLEPAPAPRPYRTFALWAVLLLAVGGVLVLSASLLRQMRSAPD